jgi:hypothetical protein
MDCDHFIIVEDVIEDTVKRSISCKVMVSVDVLSIDQGPTHEELCLVYDNERCGASKAGQSTRGLAPMVGVGYRACANKETSNGMVTKYSYKQPQHTTATTSTSSSSIWSIFEQLSPTVAQKYKMANLNPHTWISPNVPFHK